MKPLLLVALALALTPATASAKTKWLCEPGLEDNPCAVPMDVARYAPDGRLLGRDEPEQARRRIDCFDVYAR